MRVLLCDVVDRSIEAESCVREKRKGRLLK